MSIKSGLILCAGKGTRMGSIGTQLPKPLWPLFEKTLIDWQIIKMRELGIEQIYINVHHGAELIEEYLQKNWNGKVIILREKELLNVGGAISNLKAISNSTEKLLVVTADMLLSFDKNYLQKMEEALANEIACLLLMKVDPESKYNKVIFNKDKVLEIKESSLDEFTFSGVSIINLQKIEAKSEPQTFFEGLLSYKKNVVRTYFNSSIDFFDLGTLNEFVETHEKILVLTRSKPQSGIIKDLYKYNFISKNLLEWTDCSFKFLDIKKSKNKILMSYEGLSQEIELSISKS